MRTTLRSRLWVILLIVGIILVSFEISIGKNDRKINVGLKNTELNVAHSVSGLDGTQAFTGDNVYKIVMYRISHVGLNNRIMKMDFQKCHRYKNCKLVQKRKSANGHFDAAAVILSNDGFKLPNHLDEDQVFVFMQLETLIRKTHWRFPRNYINWTMTYRTDSDIPFLYGSVVSKHFRMSDKLTDEYSIPKTDLINGILDKRLSTGNIDGEYYNPKGRMGKNYTSIFHQKNSSVLWLVSHCSTDSLREEYVKEMEAYIDVVMFGECSKDVGIICPKWDMKVDKAACDVMFTTKYKFYLSFENALCRDYITEKVYKWFKKDIIVVVRGARDYSRFLPRGTYIDANEFSSPRELAIYLNNLGSNETEYTAFLKRKDAYTVINKLMQTQLAYCHLCHRLNNLGSYRKVVHDISEWWTNQTCVRPEDITDI